MAFGDAGPYERLWGRAHSAVDPDAPAQAGIVDIGKAPRNADGLVTFASDLLTPTQLDPARGNRRVFFAWGDQKSAVQGHTVLGRGDLGDCRTMKKKKKSTNN